MVIPTPIVLLPFLIAFVMLVWQYYRIDPRRRVLNLRFGIMASGVAAMFFYIFHANYHPDDWQMSWIFLGWAVICLLWAWRLARRMPPRENH